MLQDLLADEDTKVVLVDNIEEDYFFASFGYILSVFREGKPYRIASLPKIAQLIEADALLKGEIIKVKKDTYTSTIESIGPYETDSGRKDFAYVTIHNVTQPMLFTPEVHSESRTELMKVVGDKRLEKFVDGVCRLEEHVWDSMLDGWLDDYDGWLDYEGGSYLERVSLKQARQGDVPEPGTPYAIIASSEDKPRFAPSGWMSREECESDDLMVMRMGGQMESYLNMYFAPKEEGGKGLKHIYNRNNMGKIVKDPDTLIKMGPITQPIYFGSGNSGVKGGFASSGRMILVRNDYLNDKTYRETTS